MTAEFDNEQKKRYLESLGTRCPFCLGFSVGMDERNYDNNTGMLYESVSCGECGGRWTDEYKMVDVYLDEGPNISPIAMLELRARETD